MDYRRLDLNLLVVLDSLLEERGVNATARRLGMSQPNVSFALNKLRVFFADDLLVRQGNAMAPTAMAERMREPVRRILNTVDKELLAQAGFDPAHCEHRFTISMSDIGELVFLPRLIAELERRAPGITLRCHSLPPTELERAMADGTVDLALGYFPDLQGSAFMTQKLFDHPFVCIARAEHPRIRDVLDLETFLSLGHIVVSQKGRSQELFEARLRHLGLSRRVVLESPHFMSVPLLVAGSDLISTVPYAVGELFASMAHLRLIAPPFDTRLIELKQFWHRSQHRDPATVWLRNLIAELFIGRDTPMAGMLRPSAALSGKR
jgi:DNA-binding transcriptional LysR family regulator